MGEGEAGENLELSLQQFGGKADPSFQTQWFVSEPGRRMELAALEERRTSTGSTSRRNRRPTRRSASELYVQMQKLMDESAAYVWLTHEVNIFATKKWLKPSILPNGDDWQYRYFEDG